MLKLEKQEVIGEIATLGGRNGTESWPPPPQEPWDPRQNNQQFIGTWGSDFGGLRSYVFRADGTGEERFGSFVDRFDWIAPGNNYLILQCDIGRKNISI